MKILILCTGNSCRSQMAEGILRNMDASLVIFSAGTRPEKRVNPFAIRVMNEIGIDISEHRPKQVERFLDESFDYVITVCDQAKEVCPFFSGDVKNRLHISFDDPADATGSPDEVMAVYRRVRDEIMDRFTDLYKTRIKAELQNAGKKS